MPCVRASFDDRRDDLGRKQRRRHPDLEEVDVLQLQVPHVRTRFVDRLRLERRCAGIRTADVESLTGGVRARREKGAGAGLAEQRHGFRFVVARRPHRRDTPAELRQPVPLHVVGRLVDVTVHVDETGQQHLVLRVDNRGALGNPDACARSRGANAIAVDHDDRVVHGWRSGAVDEARADDRDRAFLSSRVRR